MGRIADGWIDQQAGIASGTHSQQNGCFARWERFLACCGVQDKFLDTFSVNSRIYILSAFAASVRRNEHGKTGLSALSAQTVRVTINNVCAQFRTSLRGSPNLEADGRPSLRIKRQIDGYISHDPATKHQKCIPPSVFRKLLHNTSTPLSTAIGQLTTGALFFGMHSCEYSKVTCTRKTDTLRLRDIRFFDQRSEVPKSVTLSHQHITSVSITFPKTKNGDKEVCITMHNSDSDLCPVKAWVAIVQRILSYHKTDLHTYVNYVEVDGKPRHIESKEVMSAIRLAVSLVGSHELGFGPDAVGTHSIRSSFAMFLHLNKIPAEEIMLQGRWKSMAFIDYIRPQVSEFSSGLSKIMIQANNFSLFQMKSIQNNHNLRLKPLQQSHCATLPTSITMARDIIIGRQTSHNIIVSNIYYGFNNILHWLEIISSPVCIIRGSRDTFATFEISYPVQIPHTQNDILIRLNLTY